MRKWICAGLLALSAPASAAPPVGAVVPRLDAHGHPLPPGAVARFGDCRQRFSRVMSFSFSPDGRRIARSRALGTDIRETATGRDVTPAFVRGLRGSVTFTPTGQFYHADHDAKLFRVLDAATGTVLIDLSAPGRFISRVEFLPHDGGILAAVLDHADGAHVRYFGRVEGPKSEGRVITRTGYEPRFTFLSRGPWVAVSASQGTISVLDLATGAPIGSHKLQDLGTNSSPVAALPDGQSFLVAHGGQLVSLQVGAEGIVLGELGRALSQVQTLRVAADGTVVQTGYHGELWRTTWPDDKPVRKVEPGVGSRWAEPVLSPDGRVLVEYGWSETARVRDLAAGRELFRYEELSPVQSVQFLAGRRVRVSTPADTRVYDLPSGREVARADVPESPTDANSVISPDGRWRVAITPPFGRRLTLREASTGRERWHFDAQPLVAGGVEQVCEAVFRPGDRELLVVLGERSLLLDVATGREIVALPGGQRATFSADGRLVALGRKPPIRVIEVSTRAVRQTFDRPGPTVNDTVASRLRFSRDGRFLAGFGWSYGAVVWSVEDGTLAYSSMHPMPDNGFAVGDISPDGRWLAHSDRFQSQLRVWDWTAPPGTSRAVVLRGHHGEATDAGFTPDGKHLLTAGQDGTVLVWDMAWIARAAVVRSTHRTDDDLWDDLGSRDAVVGGRAVAEWVRRPPAAVERFRRELPPTKAPDPAAVAALVSRLDHDSPAARDAAEAELAGLAELAETALRPVAERSASAEQRTRARRLLDRLGSVVTDPHRLRTVRAVEAAERIGTADARRLLADWAAGAPAARLTREARAALDRLAER